MSIKNKTVSLVLALLMLYSIAAFGGSCSNKQREEPSGTPASDVTDTSSPTVDADEQYTVEPLETAPVSETSPLYTIEPLIVLEPYDGVVEHIFFHEVIAYPELAFHSRTMARGYAEYMVTASEFIGILESLHRNNYILVNMNDVWTEQIGDNGVPFMERNTLMLPEGKKPIIISFDDISFYEYMKGEGFMEKLIIGTDGEIWASGFDLEGNPILSQDLAAVPILDKFVKEHPDFSLAGAKGCIALTGYEGILGYRTQYSSDSNTDEARIERMHEIARVRPVIAQLKETGWYFASHSYGHIKIASSSIDRVRTDANRWMDEVGALVGDTQIFIYPYGERLDGNDVHSTGPGFRHYHDLGFRLFASVGYESFSHIKTDISAVVCDRMNVDGIAFDTQRERHLKFYDVYAIRDPLRPPT